MSVKNPEQYVGNRTNGRPTVRVEVAQRLTTDHEVYLPGDASVNIYAADGSSVGYTKAKIETALLPKGTTIRVERDVEFATKDELLTFCREVREAGGGEVLDALKGSVAGDSQNCLIANNLNFSCTVEAGGNFPDGTPQWHMTVTDKEAAEKIGLALGLRVTNVERDANQPSGYASLGPAQIILPKIIGNAASAFDHNHPEFAEFQVDAQEFSERKYAEQHSTQVAESIDEIVWDGETAKSADLPF